MSSNITFREQVSAWQQSPVGFTAIAGVIGLLSIFIYSTYFPSRKGGIRELSGISLISAWQFFARRSDFLRSNFLRVGEPFFKFNVLQHSVVAIRGVEGRQAFFDNRSLSFTEGYRILMGAVPRLSDISVKSEDEGDTAWFNKKLLTILSKSRLTDVLPALLEGVDKNMVVWGKEGQIDPFKNIHDLVFFMTVRMAACGELADNPKDIALLQDHYWTLEKNATPASLLLPWLPLAAKKRKQEATKNLFTMLYGYIEKRRAASPSADSIDVLIAEGLDNSSIIRFIFSMVFAGVVNTGVNACWALIYLCINKEWKAKVSAEVNALIAAHTNTSTSSSEPLHKRLSEIPISAWEDEMPVMEVVIRETIRIVVNGAALRRNITDDLAVADKIIPKGSFLTYQVSDVHLNPEIYTNPMEFDPHRFGPGREEDKKQTHGYLGWGVGRHPCTGMKAAKLELKVILAMFLTAYDFDVVDSAGEFPKSFPVPNYNDIHKVSLRSLFTPASLSSALAVPELPAFICSFTRRPGRLVLPFS